MFDDKKLSISDLKRLVDGDLPPRVADELWRVMRHDPEAQRRFDRLVQAERALEGIDRGTLGSGAKARIGARLMGSRPEPAPRPWFRWSTIGAMVATTAAVTFALIGTIDRPGGPGVDTAAGTVGAPVDRDFGARAGRPGLKVTSDFVLQVLQVSVNPDAGVQVRPADQLIPSDELRFAAFVRDVDCRVSVVAVRDDGTRQVILRRASVSPMLRAQRLDVAWAVPPGWSGPVHFVGVFEHQRQVDLATLEVAARDEQGLSVRVVRASIGDRPQ